MQLKISPNSYYFLIKPSIFMRTRINYWVLRASLAVLLCCGIFFSTKTNAQCGYSYQNAPFVLTVDMFSSTTTINQGTLGPILGPTAGCTLYFEEPLGTLTATYTFDCTMGPGPYTITVRSDDDGVIDGSTSAPVSVTVNLVDKVTPLIICPNNVVGTTDADGTGDCLLHWNTGGISSIALTNVFPVAPANPGEYSENCSHTVEFNVNGGAWIAGNDAGDYSYSPGVNTVTYRITDMSGNTVSCSFTVTVTDNEAPIWNNSLINGLGSELAQDFTVPPTLRRIVLDCNHANYAADLAYLLNTWLPSATDNCDPTVTIARNYLGSNPVACATRLGITNVYQRDRIQYTATDAAGNVSILFTLHILTADNKGPNYANGTVPSGPAVEGLPNQYNGPKLTVKISDYYDPTDPATPCGIDFTNAAPVINPTPSLVATPTDCQAINYFGWAVTPLGSSPAPSTLFLIGSNNPAQFYGVGNYNLGYVSYDPCLNFASYTFELEVIDDVPPIITNCPANIANVPNEAGNCAATVSWSKPVVTDNCSAILLPNKSEFQDPNGNIFPIVIGGGADDYGVFPVGTSTVTYEYSDIHGNISTCSFTVTVVDVQSPTIVCSGDQILHSICIGAKVPNYTGLGNVSDNCLSNGYSIVQSPVAGTLVSSVTTLANGSTFTVTLTVKDAAGNPLPDPPGGSNECTFTVTLLDNDKPIPTVAVLPEINPNNTTSASCGSYALAAPTAVDCNGNIIYGQATISGATFIPGAPPVYVLTPNNYVISWVYNDGNGNLETQIQIVKVTVDNTDPVLQCPTNVTTNTDAGLCSATGLGGLTMVDLSPHVGGLLAYPGPLNANEAIDNCDIVDFHYSVAGATTVAKTLGANAGNVVFNAGVNTVTYYGVDAEGNEGTCSFTITIVDQEAPTFTCGPNSVLLTGAADDVNAADCAFTLSNSNTSYDVSNVADNCAVQSITYQVTNIVPATASFTAGPSTSSLAGSTFNISNTPGSSATYTIKWTVTDNAPIPNSSQCFQTIVVTDNIDPVITCVDEAPANPALNGTRTTSQDGVTGDCIYTVSGTEFDATATDECDNNLVIEHDFPGAPSTFTLAGADLPGGVNTITWTATDNAGNVSFCTMYIEVIDDEKPSFSYCPSNIILPNVSGDCENFVTWTRPMLSSNFGPDATDNCSLPANMNITEIISDNAVQAAINNNVPYNPHSNSFFPGEIAGSSFPVGVTTITYVLSDEAGNTAVCSFTVTILDNEAPVVSNPGSQTLPSICATAVVPNYLALVNVVDNCGGEHTVVQNPAPGTPLNVVFPLPGDIFDGATFTVTITATDNNQPGLSSSSSFTVTLDDQQAPVPTIPGAALPAISVDCGALQVLSPTADDCGQVIYGIPNIGMFVPGSNPPQYQFSPGNYNIIWTYIDNQNNSSSQSQLITVNTDSDAPEILCPADITVNVPANACTATGINAFNMSAGILGNLLPGQYADNCGVVSVTYSISGATTVNKKAGNANNSIAGEILNTGVNNITFYVKDFVGNESTCTAKVTVKDLVAPVLSGIPADVTVSCNTVPTAPGIGVIGGVNASDNCTASPIITFNEVSTQIANLANCQHYSYTITRTWTAEDASGNKSTATQIITVKDITAPVLNGNFPGNFTGNTDLDVCTKLVTINVDASMVSDNCAPFNNLSITNNSPYGATSGADASGHYPKGTTTFQYTVTDPCGNAVTKTVTVTISDAQAPTPVCEQNVAIPIGVSGFVNLVPATIDNNSYDNCLGQLSLALNPSTITCSQVGQTINVVLTVTDLVGNAATCVATIHVQDNIIPTISCPADVTVACTNSINPSINPGVGVPVVNDNCTTIVSFTDATIAAPPGACTAIARTWKVSDAYNNTAVCTQKLAIQDITPPAFNGVLPANVTVSCDGNIPAAATLTASDFCDLNVGVVFSETTNKNNVNNDCDDFNYIITRTWTATDDCNNKSTHVQTITVKDNSAPVFINVPQDITVYTENYNSLLCEVPVSLDMTGNVTDCQGVGNVTITNNSPYGNGQGNASGTYHVGLYPVKFTAVDKCGNAASVTVNVYVIDNTKPIAKCDDVNLTINNSGLATLNPQDVDEGSTDNCTASQNLILSLSTTQFDCTDLGNNIVTLTVVDQAGNFNTCTSVITVVSNNSTTITLTFSATNESYAGASNASATVVVTGGSGSFTYLWSDPNHTTTPTVNGLTAGFYNVTVTDLVSGCKAVGTVEIKVNPNPTNHKISGTITTTANIPVAQVQVNLTGSSTGSVTTTNNGKYEFLLPVGSNVTVTPLKNINPVNGVTALDLAIIQQHILGGGTLNTPYKLIAADANNDGFINAADLAITQAVILGNLPNFTNNTSWVFVPKSYVFPNPANPFNPAYPKSLSYAPLNADHLNDNYWGIKVGDVEGSANPNTIIGNGPEDREYVGDMNFITTDRVLTEGSTINVDFNTEKFNDILAYQFGMDYNKEYLELTGTDAGVLPGITKSSFGLNFDTDGIITSAWYNATAQNLSSSDKAFRLSFKVKKGGKKLSQVLKLDNTKIQTVGYDKEYSPVNLGLKFKSDAVTNETYSFELFQNQPNPFKRTTVISFTLPEAESGQIEISDLKGKTIKLIEKNFEKGLNREEVTLDNIPSGVLFYKVKTETLSAVKKMVIIE